MKNKIAQFIVFIFVLLYSFGAIGQTVAKDSTTTTTSINNKETIIKSGVEYELHTGSRGGKYIIRTSRIGNEYKQYLKEEEINKLRLAINKV